MSAPVVETSSGTVQGVAGDGYQSFLGIPYAAGPVGERRFRAPQPAEPWSGVRTADSFGPVAPQLPGPLEAMLGAPPLVVDEATCLSLNIWTPASGSGSRPVMVWIHGGAFLTGSGSTPWYDGVRFATQHDVVVVTVNYRLGALGFTYLGEAGGADYQGSGSLGIQDQAAALRWVRDNIAGFGGDPGNVTIFGESAGGMSVGTLLGLPEARGLFHRAILQSGAAGNSLSAEVAAGTASKFLDALGLSSSDVARLHELPTEALLDAQAKVGGDVSGGLAFQPVVDGQVLDRPPLDAVAAGSAAGVQLLAGTNLDEWKLFSMMDPRFNETDDASLLAAARVVLGDAAEAAVAGYRAQRPSATPADILGAMTTDSVFRIPAIRLAEAQQKAGGSVWMYLFDWATPVMGGRFGSCHALEIPFVFDNLHQPGAAFFVGDAPPAGLATTMHAAWAAFARSGNPETPATGSWAPYEPGSRTTMVFGDKVGAQDDPMGEERALWDDVK